VSRAVVASLLLAGAACAAGGCDRFDAPAAAETNAAERASAKARASAKDALTAIVKAAQAATASCVAGELRWEADPDGNVVARHFSRPCIPERCTPAPGEIEALRTATRAARALVDSQVELRVPSYQSVVALAEAMVSFADTAQAGMGGAKDRPARMSGLSMHYGALVTAYRALYPEAKVPVEPPSLGASLGAAEPGGDPCKGWAIPKYCDVRGVRVPREHKWRSDPPCIEVEGIKR